ncbi:hypothetical protein [Rhizobium rosettiformans]|uniref:hypothetical protein n=1 Tax=Rhizobium rosettiformans TaxID=1368430 RepID=UPI00285549DC|nr:hypothetical protein [Rhizobium rosettiformans]MDR7066720.1 hypothetical protein [Rhizobium rosettiformans]
MVSKLRAARFRRSALSFEKAISVGFRSGEKPCPLFFDQLFGALALMKADIVEDDDVAFLQSRGKLRLDPGLEDPTVHRRIDDPWCRETMATQSGDEGLRFPVSEGSIGCEAAPPRRPTGAFRQACVG